MEIIRREMAWRPVILAGDCEQCPHCGAEICPACGEHFADCDCPGPHQDADYEYSTDFGGQLVARRRRRDTED